MCGIFGAFGCDPHLDLERHARLLTHRGPDGFGSYRDPDVPIYLAHCRLAIIDLSERGAQPMSNEDGSVWLTYNGEIYDFTALRKELERLGHRFVSATDSEVIIHAYEEWGERCLDQFNGMFAFAIWDRRKGRIFLARDRFGIKPIYYGILGGRLVFASEPKALIGLPFYRKEIHYPALCCYLTYTYISGEESIWKGIKRLMPGHRLVFDIASGLCETAPYWQIDCTPRSWSTADAVDRFTELMTSSVRNCLVSDVPIGSFLSGGYDSSTVAALASEVSPQVDTFTIGFEGWERDELPAARLTSSILGSTHHEDRIRKETFASLERLFDFYDEPLADSSIFPTYLVCGHARRNATVVLSGDGGDELFGGYTWYTFTENCRPLKQLAFFLGPILDAFGFGKTSLGRRCNRLEHYRRMTSPSFTVDELRRILPGVPPDQLPETETFLYARHFRKDLSEYKRWQYLDLMTYLVDNNLTKVDRASMAHSLEVRVPFLDHRIAELAFSLPEDLRIRDGQKKYLISLFLERKGLPHLLNLPKQGFSCPWGLFWPAEDAAAGLRTGVLIREGILDRDELERVLNTADSDLKLLQLLILEKWAARWLF